MISKSYTLSHRWLKHRKPNDVGNNTLKYQRIDPAERAAARKAWNSPVLWPLGVALLVLDAGHRARLGGLSPARTASRTQVNLQERRQRLECAAAGLSRCAGMPNPSASSIWAGADRPALHAELLALPEMAVARLNDDTGAALDLLGRYLPEVAEVAALSDIPACPESRLGDDLGSRWAWEIPGRKQQQIEAFARAARPEGRSVIDWCGGKGHLGRLLALEWALPVHTLEIDAALCADGKGLAGKLAVDQHFWPRDALTVTGLAAGRATCRGPACLR